VAVGVGVLVEVGVTVGVSVLVGVLVAKRRLSPWEIRLQPNSEKAISKVMTVISTFDLRRIFTPR
jgi:hypothetical protein